MSATSVGTNLLANVEEVGLDELLLELRHCENLQPVATLGVPAIDRLLEIFRVPKTQETPTNQHWSSTQHHGAEQGSFYGNDFSSPSRAVQYQQSVVPAPVIEVSSQRSASGKTNLLYYLTSISILPRQCGGNATTVVWIDADGRFSALRLAQILQQLLLKHSTNTTEATHDVVQASLKHVHVLHPQSSTQLISILSDLKSYLLDSTAHHSVARALGLIVLHSATAFYWQDRFEADVARLERGQDPGFNNQPSRTSEIITHLKNLQSKFESTVLLTTNPASNTRSRAQGQPSEPAASSPWTSFATMTLQLSRETVPLFSATMSLQDCLRDREKRFQAVQNSKFIVGVDWTTRDMWTRQVRQAIEQLARRGSFLMTVDEEGVVLEDGHG